MFAQLGTIQFNTIKTFGAYSERASARYAEHTLLDGKPELQRTGSSLNEVSLSIFLHASFCNPKEEYGNLKDARDNGTIMPLLWGNGEIEGDFVISNIDATREETATDGTLLGVSVEVSLKEFVIKNKLQQEQNDNRNKAKAVGDKKPITTARKNVSNCAGVISGIVNKIFNHYSQINNLVQTGEIATPVSRSKILSHLSASRLLTEDLLKRYNDSIACNDIDLTDIKFRSQQHLISVNNFNQTAANNRPNEYQNQNAYLGGTARRLKESAQQLINQTIIRK